MKYLSILLVVLQTYCYGQQKTIVKSNEDLTIEIQQKGTIENGIYKCNLFDWQIEIPSNFRVISEERIKELEDKGFTAIQENATDGKKIKQQTNNLLSIEKDKYNCFNVTYESLNGTKRLSLEEHKLFMNKLLEETYTGKGIKFDLVTSDIKMGIHNFYKILIHLYHPKTEQLILTQEFYVTYINDNLFSANMNYNDENLGYVMNYNFMKSFK